ncbi:hypothetical protein T8J41_10875 [Nitratireductor rhodophyticola]|uniref:Flagellar protein n=1 Tax=Nitratireductor rhodophyticola TaxID=2854036 RepID=A0ABS7R9Q6_9HYPH|nr:hypothetical protein [Nitratireductor rhodophyticola]MBY8917656.1 hypothetical protein [Nitratireductor rhodophyticola]MBY8922367.1 hypothetical protein [Nitratireductor rhodophyticola]MEC9245786.1 hypothetical protein [Pseudomonadota bacterium]WPZ12686.1 hypothetical protein T8J41_10875 [Nitratireductor rhodophyticola]
MTLKLASLELPDGRRTEPNPTAAPIVEAPPPSRRSAFLPRRLQKASALHKPSSSRSDWMIMLGGIGLAAVCAMFPWYIFFNQEQFGVRPMTFAGRPSPQGPSREALPALVGARIPSQMIPLPQVDYTSTGTVDRTPTGVLEDQPFPGDEPGFRLVHAVGGRAMIEDEDGYWLVQRGSRLPDGSRVAQIVWKNGQWEMITTRELVIKLSAEDGT